jgi:hypothetical protein
MLGSGVFLPWNFLSLSCKTTANLLKFISSRHFEKRFPKKTAQKTYPEIPGQGFPFTSGPFNVVCLRFLDSFGSVGAPQERGCETLHPKLHPPQAYYLHVKLFKGLGVIWYRILIPKKILRVYGVDSLQILSNPSKCCHYHNGLCSDLSTLCHIMAQLIIG